MFDVAAMREKVISQSSSKPAISAISAIETKNEPIAIAAVATIATIVGSSSVEQRSCTWKVVLKNGRRFVLIATPAINRSEVDRSYRDEGVAKATIAQGCTQCIHYSQPFKYCGSMDRDDLPKVYSDGNPLRQLPADMGTSCEAFQTAKDDS